MSNDATIAAHVSDAFCSCQPNPLGLPFILTHGCLVHDACVCHTAEHDPERMGDEACAWCDSYVALLRAIGTLTEVELKVLKVKFHLVRAGA